MVLQTRHHAAPTTTSARKVPRRVLRRRENAHSSFTRSFGLRESKPPGVARFASYSRRQTLRTQSKTGVRAARAGIITELGLHRSLPHARKVANEEGTDCGPFPSRTVARRRARSLFELQKSIGVVLVQTGLAARPKKEREAKRTGA